MVIGNNSGLDETGQAPFPKLKHAEREARRLREKLLAYSNFDPDVNRTILLTGATKAMVMDAARAIAEQKERDIQSLGKADSLFALFFTGHGLNGKLLLNDGPLEGEDLGKIFSIVGADFNIGIFDACYSGSLDPSLLAQKGIELSPGNIFRELPEDILTAKGNVWFVSSGPGEVSYEDQNLGGVFTHFFTQALQKAKVDGPGITLEQIWHYTRNMTVAHTSEHGRRQMPQQYVSNMKSTGPMYFSFPIKREASLVLLESIQGEFLLSYAGGQLNERFYKKAGELKKLAVYPGKARLMLFEKSGEVTVQEEISFMANEVVTIRSQEDSGVDRKLGEQQQTLWEKGIGAHYLMAETRAQKTTWQIGAGYFLQPVPQGFLSSFHQALAYLRLDYGQFTLGAQLGYGTTREDLGEWSYQLNALQAGLQAGYGWDISSLRLSLLGGLQLASLWQEYDDKTARHVWQIAPGASLVVHIPLFSRFSLEASLLGSYARLPAVGQSAGYHWRFLGGGGLALLVQL
jgi:hypothetical protein